MFLKHEKKKISLVYNSKTVENILQKKYLKTHFQLKGTNYKDYYLKEIMGISRHKEGKPQRKNNIAAAK